MDDSDKNGNGEEEMTPDDPMAWRAFLTAMIGVPLLPPLLQRKTPQATSGWTS